MTYKELFKNIESLALSQMKEQYEIEASIKADNSLPATPVVPPAV